MVDTGVFHRLTDDFPGGLLDKCRAGNCKHAFSGGFNFSVFRFSKRIV